MNYDHMTTKEVKQTLVNMLTKVRGKEFAFGWVMQSYLQNCDDATERRIAISTLNDMMMELV